MPRRGPRFRLLFGAAEEQAAPPPPSPEHQFGLGAHYLFRAHVYSRRDHRRPSERTCHVRRRQQRLQTAATHAQAVTFAECTRDNGAKAFPGPDAAGELRYWIKRSSSLDPAAEAWKKAIGGR